MVQNTRITLVTAFDLYILDCRSQQVSPHTLRFYNGRLGLFLRWCDAGGVVYLDDIGPQHIKQYLVDAQERGNSSAYIHSHARAIKSFFNYCIRDELIEATPFRKVKMPVLEQKIKPAIPMRDIGKILKCCHCERDKTLVLFLLDSGLRASELCALNVEHIDFETGSVSVHKGKMGRGRIAQIGNKVRHQIKKYWIRERGGIPAGTEPAIGNERNGQRLVYAGLKQVMRRLRDESGVQLCSLHNFRRTFAINCLRSGMDIFTLARLMGHKDLTVLRSYLALLDDDLRAAHAKHGVVDNMF